MKIAIVNRYHPSDVLGGSELQCSILHKQWQLLGHDVVYFALDGCGKRGNEIIDSLCVNRLNDHLGLPSFTQLERELLAGHFDLVYLRSFNQLYLCARTCQKVGVPCLYNTCNVTDLIPFKKFNVNLNLMMMFKNLRGVINRYLNWKTLTRIPVVTINQDQLSLLANVNNLKTSIYNSMVDRLKNDSGEKEKLICWVSNIKERKQPEEFLKLVKKLSGKGWSFAMAGEIQARHSYYKTLIDECAQNCPDFEYLGPQSVEQVDALVQRASLLVHTCLPEGFGNNFIQAWLASCPTVSLCFDADGIMQREKIGFCSGSFDTMVEDTEKLMNDDELRVSMGQRARQWALNHHNPQINAQRYLDFFKQII